MTMMARPLELPPSMVARSPGYWRTMTGLVEVPVREQM